MKKKNIKIIVCLAIAAVCIFIVTMIYINANNGHCWLCKGNLQYIGTVVKGDKSGVNTYYRYQCDKHPLHMFDLLIKIPE